MNAPSDPTAASDTPSQEPLLSEIPDRYQVAGLRIVNRETGKPESYIPLSRDEIDMPGYVESVERGYNGTEWVAERTRDSQRRVQAQIDRANRLDPSGMLTDEQVEKQAQEGHGHVRPRFDNAGRQVWAKCGGPNGRCVVCQHEKRLYGTPHEPHDD